jgi:hypothetical protein
MALFYCTEDRRVGADPEREAGQGSHDSALDFVRGQTLESRDGPLSRPRILASRICRRPGRPGAADAAGHGWPLVPVRRDRGQGCPPEIQPPEIISSFLSHQPLSPPRGHCECIVFHCARCSYHASRMSQQPPALPRSLRPVAATTSVRRHCEGSRAILCTTAGLRLPLRAVALAP